MNGGAATVAGKRLDWALLLGDFAIGAWLWFSFRAFNGGAEAARAGVLGPAVAVALISLLIGTHRHGADSRVATAARFAGLFLAIAASARAAAALGWIAATPRETLWLGAAAAITLLLLRGFYWRLSGSQGARGAELVRWIAVGTAGTLAMYSFYFAGSVGSGDSHWYVVMLTDFLVQLKAGVFPVWVGQSPYAFNGAVSPLRYAPGFQYYGGIVDLLTAQSLQPVALKNLCLCLSGVGGAFSAYACMRPVVGARRWIACLLAALWVCGPGVLAPVVSGDQYMTFIAMPFVPLVLHGCWRVVAIDDAWGRIWISSGLAALWICHPPIGLWMTVISGAIYLGVMLARRHWISELRRLALMGVIFLGMGSLPFISLACLDNQIHIASAGGSAAQEVHHYFPGNVRPINPAGGGLADYQIGYALLGALAASLLLLVVSRPKAAGAFALASVLIVPFTVPVPWVTDALWCRMPSWFVTIDNVWPMQRLFLIWSALAAFLSAIVLGSARISGTKWRHAAVIILLCVGLAWSAEEARKLSAIAARTRSSQEQSRVMEGPDNTQLGRYAYSSFAAAPSYASHGYMDAWFENRLLDRVSLLPVVTNADAAAPGSGYDPGDSVLVSKGLMTAENITQSAFYFLRPTLTLDPGKRYALRLEFFEQGLEGVLQLTQATMFREYLLPDSGVGIGRSGPPRAFGTEPTSGKVLSLIVHGKEPAPLTALLITKRADHKDFIAGRYWLYTYERSRLPIAVESWIPYTVRFAAPAPAYLESPRMWLKDWRASVNGVPVPTERSPEGLVMVPVQAGPSVLTLEYVPPAVLRASFWVLFCFWLAAGAAALCWLFGVAPGVAFRKAVRPRLIGSFAVLLAAAAVVATAGRLRARVEKAAFSTAAGPMEVRFMMPRGQAGATQPLLSTGHAQAGTIVFAAPIDDRHIRLSADVWGRLFTSGPIEFNYSRVHTLVVSDSALFPENQSAVSELPVREVRRLRHEFRAELDGVLQIQAGCYAFEAGPKEVFVGRAPFGSTSAPVFSGAFIDSRRLPIPRLLGMPAGGSAHLRLRFPTDRAGTTESLLTVSRGATSDSFSVTYSDSGKLTFTMRSPRGAISKSPEINVDTTKAHSMDFWPSKPAPGEEFAFSCAYDGRLLFGDRKPFPLDFSPLLSSGVDLTAERAAQARFSGPELDLSVTSGKATAAEEYGPVHMLVTFPSLRPGRHEPILTTGRTGAGDLIYVVYADDHHIRLGFDHWGGSGALSEPIAVDYKVPHDVWVIEGSLYPAIGDDSFWGATAPSTRSSLMSTVAIVLDGKTVMSLSGPTHPTTRDEVTPVRNTIGGSTADPEFSGVVHLAERCGTELPPGFSR